MVMTITMVGCALLEPESKLSLVNHLELVFSFLERVVLMFGLALNMKKLLTFASPVVYLGIIETHVLRIPSCI